MEKDNKCMVCGGVGELRKWNALDIYECMKCGLAWRKHFDLGENYYADLNLEKLSLTEEKAALRLRNSWSRYRAIKQFLPQESICDVGCGEGFFLEVLKKEGKKYVWGIEPSLFSYNQAKTKGHEVFNKDISYLKDMGEKVNTLTLFNVIEHLTDPETDLETLRNALAPNGVLVIETPNINASLQKVTDHKNSLIYHEHLFYWSKRALKSFLEQHGFKVLCIKHRSFDWSNASINSSLIRLGLRKFTTSLGNLTSGSSVEGRNQEVKSKKNFLKGMIRKVLAYAVHILRRDDYLLVVARRVR
jgi:2-polyprenyl-3-methyl-5-hydroxy-6-metoxy-1,4-benzoquinol methylase